ncbi:MAG: RAMP superfamily protein [bacterium ADurb.Bin157]|nr:MAG: RAMP superfamily protein [bacterium ADurb.Bin157]
MIKHYKIKLHTLSQIHIGSGEVYDPTQFVINEDGMCVFDRDDFIKSLNDDQLKELSKLSLDSNKPVSVFRFFKDKFDKTKVKHRVIKISKDLREGYQKLCNSGALDKSVINQFELKRNIFNPIKGMPYIPGSSLKGCIKTFWMSEQNKLQAKIKNESNIKKLENSILEGSFGNDPFRFVKVSDLYPVVEDNNEEALTEIVYAVMIPKKADKEARSELTVALEVIKKGVVFKGTISIDDQGELPSRQAVQIAGIETLMQTSKNYYVKKMLSENDLLGKLGAMRLSVDKEFAGKLYKSSFLVRLGHHSSAEFITIDDNKKIKISPPRVNEKVFAESATTIWLSSNIKKPQGQKGMKSFGWGLIEFEQEQ